jgi:hypothetical protein
VPGSQSHRDPIRGPSHSHRGRGSRVVAVHASADRLSGNVRIRDAVRLLPVRDHARHDHGHLPIDGSLSRRLRKLSRSAHVRRSRHGIPVHEYAERLGIPGVCDHSRSELLRPRGVDGGGMDAIPATGHRRRHPGNGLGHHSHVVVPRCLHRRVHDGRIELRDHGAASALQRNDAHADASIHLGHLCRDDSGPAGLPGPFGRRDHDAAGPCRRHELLHASTVVDGRGIGH